MVQSVPAGVRLVGMCCLVCLAACKDGESPAAPATPSTPPVAPGGGQVPPPPEGSGTGATALEWTVPDGWVAEAPATQMRKAQYRVPGAAGDALLVVFYFGPGQGGPARANIARWADQFVQSDGRPGSQVMKNGEKKVGDIPVYTVEVTGTYSGGFMAKGPPQEGQMLLGAVATGPDANWFFKLTGPEATITEQRAAFDALLDSLRVGS